MCLCFCMDALPEYMYAQYVKAWFLCKSEEGSRAPETQVMDGCEPPTDRQKLDPCPLQEE